MFLKNPKAMQAIDALAICIADAEVNLGRKIKLTVTFSQKPYNMRACELVVADRDIQYSVEKTFRENNARTGRSDAINETALNILKQLVEKGFGD